MIELSATNLARCYYDGQKPGPLENKILSCVCPEDPPEVVEIWLLTTANRGLIGTEIPTMSEAASIVICTRQHLNGSGADKAQAKGGWIGFEDGANGGIGDAMEVH